MSSLKRTGDPLQQSSPAKHPNLESTTDAIEAQSMDVDSVAPADVENDLKLVDPTRLPQSKLPTLNDVIIGKLAKYENLDVCTEYVLVETVLSKVQTGCKDILLQEASIVEDLADKYKSQLVALCKHAIESGDFSRIMLISQFWKQEDVPSAFPFLLRVEFAFQAPFIGNSCMLLKSNIEQMYRTSISGGSKANPDQVYMNYASIIQSSGSGKSRLVDEVAKHVFTIPLNIRTSTETSSGAYPLPDNEVRDLLIGLVNTNEEATYQNYICFLAALFTCTVAELNKFGSNGVSSEIWRSHLAQPGKRRDLYVRVKEHVEKLQGRSAGTHVGTQIQAPTPPLVSSYVTMARRELDALVRKIPGDANSIKVLVYFDEAHVLADPWMNQEGGKVQQKLPLDILVGAINDLRQSGLFALLLSTQSKLDHLAPSSSFARSARYRKVAATLHPPITETPFDCFDDNAPVKQEYLTEDILSDIGFLACFGRPLWASVLYGDAHRALAQVTGKPASFQVDDNGREQRYQTLIEFATAKLLNNDKIYRKREDHSQTAQAAVLDARIMLSFEAGRPSAHQREIDLVSSHMRTVYSVPRSREYIRSGYSSEPILAEAAARVLHVWRTQKGSSDPDPALDILADNVSNDLVDRGELGEAVARLLLLRARDRAALITYGEKDINFSRPVPLVTFVEALFPKKIADELLDSYPDNLPQGEKSLTFRVAFKDALINFTHFAKWGDNSATTQKAAFGAYVRHAAAICRNNAPTVDAVIPVRFEKSAKFSPEGMTAVILQFKLRVDAGGPSKYEILEEKLKPPFFPASAAKDSPYMTIIMDLGVTPTPSLLAQTSTDVASKAARKAKLERQNFAPGVSTDQQKSPSKAVVRSAPKLHHPPRTHPRYGIYVCGCSPSVYAVIDENEKSKYKHIIRSGDLLGEHPRQDKDSLSGVRRQKPFMFEGVESWHWLASKADPKQEEEAATKKEEGRVPDDFYRIQNPPSDSEATEEF